MNISYNLVTKEELPAAIEIELTGFHPDEAASLSKFEYRREVAPELFLGAYIEQSPPLSHTDNPLSTRKLIGYVVSTISAADSLTHESMATHTPPSEGGVSVCVHSVCVDQEWRRKGVALGLLKEYVSRLEREGDRRLKRILLICHDDLIELYRAAGFKLVGKSKVVHGPREWFEMKRDLDRRASSPSQALREALSAASSLATSRPVRSKPEGQRFVSFPSVRDLVKDDPSAGGQTNKFKIVCPRQGCGSVILLQGVAKLVEAASVQIDSPTDPPPASLLTPLAPPPETIEWWLVTPSPMAFENVGFSKGLALPDNPEVRMKLLSCAECDLGPLGWCQEGGKEFWLACARVAYV